MREAQPFLDHDETYGAGEIHSKARLTIRRLHQETSSEYWSLSRGREAIVAWAEA